MHRAYTGPEEDPSRQIAPSALRRHNRISLNKMCNLQTFTIFCFGSTIIWNIMIIFKECVALS